MDLIEKLKINLFFGDYIKINQEKTEELIDFHIKNKIFKENKPYDWSDKNFYLEKDRYSSEEISNFFTIGNSINFKYWDNKNKQIIYCQGEKKGLHVKGARYMWRCLKNAIEENLFPLLSPKELINFSKKDFINIFSDDYGINPFYMSMNERIKNLKDLGKKLNKNWDDNFFNLLNSTNNSIVDFVKKCRNIRAFDDPLCKLTMVNAILHTGRGIYNFNQPLFPGIDYQLMKQMLRIGAILPNGDIDKKLKRRLILENEESIEIRNATLYVFKKIMKKTGIPGEIIDNKWWMNKDNCSEDNPSCGKCPFNKVCDKKIELFFPMENTRYY